MRRNLPHELLEQDVNCKVYEGHGACACAWGRIKILYSLRARVQDGVGGGRKKVRRLERWQALSNTLSSPFQQIIKGLQCFAGGFWTLSCT